MYCDSSKTHPDLYRNFVKRALLTVFNRLCEVKKVIKTSLFLHGARDFALATRIKVYLPTFAFCLLVTDDTLEHLKRVFVKVQPGSELKELQVASCSLSLCM